MKSISLFTGTGGLDLGLEAAGFEPAICIELDEDARKTLQLNRGHWSLLEPGDIHAHRPEEIMEKLSFDQGKLPCFLVDHLVSHSQRLLCG